MEWINELLGGKVEKEATLVPVAENKEATDKLKLETSNWIKEAMNIDETALEAEEKAKLSLEAKLLGKTAAYEMGDDEKTTIEKDYEKDVKILSDYVLAEMLAEYRAAKDQVVNEQFYEYKEKAKADVASGRAKCESELLDLVGKHTAIDWKKSFEKFSKDAKPAEPKEKDLYEPKAPEAPHKFDSPSEDKFKTPKDQDKAIPGNGREADERTDATKQAGVLQKDLTEGLGKVAEQVKHNLADDKGNLAMPEGKKTADDKPVEAVEEPTAGDSTKTVGDKSDQAAEANSPEKGEKAKTEEAVNKEANKEAHCGHCAEDKKADAAPGAINPTTPDVPASAPVAKVAEENCPVCGGPGENLGNLGQRDHFRCQGCGVTFSHDKEASCEHCASLNEIISQASKADVIKMVKEAKLGEIPWTVEKQADGSEVIVKRTVEGKEEKEEEITK